MKKIIPLGIGLCFLSLSVHAEELMPEQLIQKEYKENKVKINEIFQDKIQKITARESLPERMRQLLTDQASEVRMFDLDTLQKKAEMKQRHVMEREKLKEDLRRDAENRARWMFGSEKKFEKNRQDRKDKEQAVVNEAVQKDAAPQQDKIEK